MEEYKDKIYPKELVLNKENKLDSECHFLDINIKIIERNSKNSIITNLYDKRDDFSFTVNNFPILSGNIHFKNTHGIVISQLLRYSKVCLLVEDFIIKSNLLINKLLQQFFDEDLLRKKFSLFYDKYYHMIQRYNHSKLKLMAQIFQV